MHPPRPPADGLLHLLPHQGVWGVARFVIEYARHERMDGGRDEIVLTERPLDVERDFMAAATPVHALGLGDARPRARAERLADLAVARGHAALVAHTLEDLVLGALAVRRRPELRLFAYLFEGPPRTGFGARRRARNAGRAATALACASPAETEAWRALGVRAETRAPGVDLSRYAPGSPSRAWRDARLPSRDVLLVGSLMRAVPGKHGEVLAEAVRRCNTSEPRVALMLVGDGPDYGARRALRDHDALIFVRRRVRDTQSFFRSIDAFALHVEEERAPLALLEAMATGCPAVVADRGPVSDLVGADAALFVAPGDVDAVQGALERLLDPEERQSLASVARARAIQQHDLARLRSRLAEDRGRN